MTCRCPHRSREGGGASRCDHAGRLHPFSRSFGWQALANRLALEHQRGLREWHCADAPLPSRRRADRHRRQPWKEKALLRQLSEQLLDLWSEVKERELAV